MSRIVNSTYITLDGAVENPQNWPSGRHKDDARAQEIQTQLLLDSDTVLMGRRTYEGFAPVWSAQSGDPYSPHYRDLFPLWAGGDYFPLAFSDAAVAAAARDVYDLTPAKAAP